MILLLIFGFTLNVYDTPSDAGGSISIQAFDVPRNITSITLYRLSEDDSTYQELGEIPISSCEFTDVKVTDGEEYLYRAVATNEDTIYVAECRKPVSPSAQWFDFNRTSVLIFLVLFGTIVLTYIRLARKNPEGLFIRKLPAIDAIDEAVGRSTEMGKPVLYVPGIEYITDAGTLASLTILERVGKKVAEYDSRIINPHFDPVVMATAQETLKTAFTEAGRPDAFNKDDVFYLTTEQFGFAAGVDGIMHREKPGAIFLQGYFYAESLILAETGYAIGAIQIAGTNATTQLPFFVAACDYVLIGEEMFAASAYISREPKLLGSIKGSDLAKIILIGIIGIGVIFGTFATFQENAGNPEWMNLFNRIVEFLARGAE